MKLIQNPTAVKSAAAAAGGPVHWSARPLVTPMALAVSSLVFVATSIYCWDMYFQDLAQRHPGEIVIPQRDTPATSQQQQPK